MRRYICRCRMGYVGVLRAVCCRGSGQLVKRACGRLFVETQRVLRCRCSQSWYARRRLRSPQSRGTVGPASSPVLVVHHLVSVASWACPSASEASTRMQCCTLYSVYTLPAPQSILTCVSLAHVSTRSAKSSQKHTTLVTGGVLLRQR